MHDPMTVAFEIRYPWRKYGRRGRNDFERNYREPFITIWHVDPERDGSDDSCGWFMRSRHGDAATLERITKRFAYDWDRTLESSGNTYYEGFFVPETGVATMSPMAVTLGLFQMAALEHFGSRKRAMRFIQRHLAEILLFAENNFDSLRDSIVQRYGHDRRQQRIEHFAHCIYGWILRAERPWYRHPRWHIHHWHIQVIPWQALRRFLLTRCCKCGKGFKWGESPTTDQWHRPKPRFLRGETGLYHGDCRSPSCAGAQAAAD